MLLIKMSFVRIKKIKGKEYGYIVENTWKGKGSRQKVKAYLGKVVRLQRIKEENFFDYFRVEQREDYLKNISKDALVISIIKFELINHGFVEEKGLMRNGNISVDLSQLDVRDGNKRVALAMNDGFLADITLRRLIEFQEKGSQAELSLKLAKAFVEAGIKVNEELFVAVYEKIVN